MSSSIRSPSLHIWDNVAFQRSGDFPNGNTWRPPPVPYNPLRFPKLQWSNDNQRPRQTFFNPLATAQPSKSPRINDDDEDVDAEIDRIVSEIRRLSERLDTLRSKKATKDLRSSALRPLKTSAIATGYKKKNVSFAADTMSSYRRRIIDIKVPENGGKTGKRQRSIESSKPQEQAAVRVSDQREGVTAVAAKKAMNKKYHMSGFLKQKIQWQNPAAGKKPLEKDDEVAVESQCSQLNNDPKRKRRKWSLPAKCQSGMFRFPLVVE